MDDMDSRRTIECPRCKQQLIRASEGVCTRCEEAEYRDYNKVRDLLEQHPEASAAELAELAEISVDCILRMMDRGMIRDAKDVSGARCGMCGAPAINHKKKICAGCLQKLNTEIRHVAAKVSPESQGRRMFDVHSALDNRRRR